MDTVLVPVIKDKAGKLSDKDNYRPIALASVISKVFERIILEKISQYLDVESNQYGFKKKSGTDLCIYALKEIVDTYKVLNGSVFMCLLDASKAYDRVNHRKVFEKLASRSVPYYFIRILSYWYMTQTIFYDGEMSFQMALDQQMGYDKEGSYLHISTIFTSMI